MTQIMWTNNATTTLASPITTTSATSLIVASGTGALFPSPGTGQYFKVTLNPATGSSPTPEIVHVTARSTDTFTIVRGQEGTTASTWATGALVQNLLTAGTMNALGQVIYNAGNPNGAVAGQAASASNSPSMVWDTTNGLLWVCTTSGPSGSAVWIAEAPLNSPTFTGTPAAPTPATSDNTTKLATTAYVRNYAAPIAGSSSQVFAVAAGSGATQAVNFGQFASSLGSSGSQTLPTGLILKWGVSGTLPTGSNLASIAGTFPVAFPTAAYGIWGTPNNSSSPSWVALTVYPSALSATGYTFYCDTAGTSSHTITNTVNITWFAIGS